MGSMDPLALLGNYGSDDEDEEEEEEEEEAAAAVGAAPAPAPTALPEPLPDADALLDGLGSNWDDGTRFGCAVAEEAPKRDARGTSYNAVALPDALAKESLSRGFEKEPKSGRVSEIQERLRLVERVDAKDGAALRTTKAAVKAGLAAAKKGGAMLPPQLQHKRPNQSTEDLAGMRSHSAGGAGGGKRSKGSS